MRIVPNQKPEKIFESFKKYIETLFQWQDTPNTIHVKSLEESDWWLGDRQGKHYQVAAKAIEEVWKSKPLLIREGGTIHMTRYLEKVRQVDNE